MKKKILCMHVEDSAGGIIERFNFESVSPEMAFAVLPLLRAGESLVLSVTEQDVVNSKH